ncbi:ZP domain-containing protein-like, partial [Mercenaria mercenaria]|uniref:ZP domain-containing protein-like n=1 Tax=Mercenaria mercenaria TaxID=6596 RepID=UPI00234E616A
IFVAFFFAESTSFPTVAPLHQRSDIECYPDALAIFLPDDLFPKHRNVTWRESCCSVVHNGSHYVSNILLTECGTTVLIENETVTFSNELIVHKVADDNNVANDAEDRSITYGEDYETVIPVKCIYPRFNNVSTNYSPVKQNVRFIEKRFGTLDVAMEQYENDQFKNALDTSSFPRKVPLDDDVFVRVGLNFEPDGLRVKTDQCIATSAPSPADTNWRPLIQSGCPKDRVRLLSTDESSDVRFAFKAFDFRHNASGLVYIHCEVSVCETGDVLCKMGCTSRAKRSASSRQNSHLVSSGPLFVERKEQNSKEMVTMPTVVAVVCVAVAIASVMVAIIGWTRKPRHNHAAI